MTAGASRRSKLEALKRQLEERPTAVTPTDDFWSDMVERVRNRNVLPILGGSVRLKRIFALEHTEAPAEPPTEPQTGAAANADEGATESEAVLTDLSELWASKIGYPLTETADLARVAQYNSVISADTRQEKRRFLEFLKGSLLDLAEQFDPSVLEVAPRLRREHQSTDLSFADLVTELDYPRYEDRPDPLRVLARFRLPIYLTTSYYDFIERALKAEGATEVRTQFCLWNMSEDSVAPEHRPDDSYVPTAERPLVYHLFGLEQYPQSLVLSEDDYLDFVLALARDFDTSKRLIPLAVRRQLEECSLLLMGFRLTDWEFRVLFRGLINLLHGSYRRTEKLYSVAIQLDPRYQEPVKDVDAARQYLEAYFGKSQFQVVWTTTEKFIGSLWSYWDRKSRGEP
jgi:hypothetical protein